MLEFLRNVVNALYVIIGLFGDVADDVMSIIVDSKNDDGREIKLQLVKLYHNITVAKTKLAELEFTVTSKKYQLEDAEDQARRSAVYNPPAPEPIVPWKINGMETTNKIEAIKAVRALRPLWSLKECKDYVEAATPVRHVNLWNETDEDDD